LEDAPRHTRRYLCGPVVNPARGCKDDTVLGADDELEA
jgi:hypothetical protein